MTQNIAAAMAPIRYRPQLSNAARPSTFEVATKDEHGVEATSFVAGEHPLTVYVDKREILTLMTLGAAPEALVIGYLRNQRLVDSIDELVAVQIDWEVNAASVYTKKRFTNRRARCMAAPSSAQRPSFCILSRTLAVITRWMRLRE